MLLFAMLLGGCDREVVFSVDATALAADYGDAILRVQLVHYGELDEAVELDFAAGETTYVFDTPLLAGLEYGVAAYADVNRDGHCQPAPDDLPWLFTYFPAYGIDYNWIPDPSESPAAYAACGWFGDRGDEPETPPTPL